MYGANQDLRHANSRGELSMELSQGDMFIIERETKHGVRSRQLAEYVRESSLTHEGNSFPVMNVLVEEL